MLWISRITTRMEDMMLAFSGELGKSNSVVAVDKLSELADDLERMGDFRQLEAGISR